MILALVVLSVIVLFHEFGHFLLARLNGITVVEFSLGFGPRLLSHVSKKSGTRYSWKLFPFGGSCAMLGEFGDEEGENDPAARMSVVAAGPVFNFILAFVFAMVIVSWSGYDPARIQEVTPGQAADAAGLKAGDVITKIGGRRVMIARDVVLKMLVNGNRDITVQYDRMDRETGKWESHEAFLDADLFTLQNGRYLTGIQFSGYESLGFNIPKIIKYGAAEVRYAVLTVVDSLKELVKGRISADDIAGPVRIVSIIDDTVDQVRPYGLVTVFMNILNLMVMFSANLGVMNLLPFPALDGGRLVFLAYELAAKKPVDQRIEGAVNMAGMALLMAFMVFVLFNDVRFLM